MPVTPGGACGFCGTTTAIPTAQTGSTPAASFTATTASFRARGKFEDLLLYVYDLLLMVFTLLLGWLIWALVASGSGQTPAGKLRDQVLISVKTRSQAQAWKLIIRAVVSLATVAYLGLLLINGFAVVIDIGGYYFATYGIPGIILALVVADLVFVFTPFRRRLIDWALGIRWVDGEGHSFRNYKSPGGY